MTDTILFIGGPWDGKRERVPEDRFTLRVAVPVIEGLGSYPMPSFSDRWQEHTYEKRAFCDHDKRLWVFVHTSVPKDGTMEMLIAGYRQA